MTAPTSSPAGRYLDLIDATLTHALAGRAPDNGDRHAMAIALDWLAAERGDGAATVDRTLPSDFNFRDGAGHRRPPYRGLAMRTVFRNSPAGVGHAFIDRTIADLRAFAQENKTLTAVDASDVLCVVFDALALNAAKSASDADRETARRVLGRLVANQQPDGTFLARTISDNPEPLWYAELALLHACHVYAVESDDADAHRAAERAARYLAAEVQPDHASSHPWAIAALLEIPEGIALADTMLHVAGVQEPATMDAVSLLLLADALRCGRREERR